MLVLVSLGAASSQGHSDNGSAAVINAANCSQAAVQAALAAAGYGDTVRIPVGTCTWSGGVSWTNKNPTVQGAGIDQTALHCTGCVRITSTASTSAYTRWRLSGLTFNGATPSGIVITIWDNVDSWHDGWRIDHVKFDYPGAGSGYGVFVGGATYGVIDNNVWNGGGGLAIIVVGQMSDEWPGTAASP
jgi:hypothetical protein